MAQEKISQTFQEIESELSRQRTEAVEKASRTRELKGLLI